jgi:ThiF family protein
MTELEPPVGPVRLRLTRGLTDQMLVDLRRPHPFAFERIGFLSVVTGKADGGDLLVLGSEYRPVADEHYLRDATVGARIGAQAIREALRQVLQTGRGLLHVHLHDFPGPAGFSPQDLMDQPRLVESFVHGNPAVSHGMLVLSPTSAAAWIWMPGRERPVVPSQISIVGFPMAVVYPPSPLSGELDGPHPSREEDSVDRRFARQSFLGPDAQSLIDRVRIGIAGLGGGGSHVAQQLAHIGFRHPRGFDADGVEDTNLNRLIGAHAADVALNTPKAEIARRLYLGLLPDAEPVFLDKRWQDQPELLRGCDVVVGCLDSFAGRHELEVACRRYGMPYIDIGMDVHEVEGEPPRIAGQVILSLPGGPCMWCLGFLDQEKLGREAQRYGAAGGRPQVVWPNGVLASTAVGLAVELMTGWTRRSKQVIYLTYDGNTGELQPHPRLDFPRPGACPHHGLVPSGDPVFQPVRQRRTSF